MALPNGICPPYVDALRAQAAATGHTPVLIDLGADYRFDDAWTYGFAERYRSELRGAKLIANPGCYATGMQTAILPYALSHQLDTSYPATVFGVSGYSGAGTNPSDKNDPVKLHDNLMAYSLTGHMHEREVTRQSGSQIHFTPHVAPYFQGIHLTTTMRLAEGTGDHAVFTGDKDAKASRERAIAIAKAAFDNEPLIKIDTEGIPEVRDNMHRHHVAVGGFHVDLKTNRLVMVSTIDNLLKGAATQCLQNINIALGLDELAGIDTSETSALARYRGANADGSRSDARQVSVAGTSAEIIDRSSAHFADTYGRFPLAIASGNGSMLTDCDGKSYIDFYAGIAVNALGTAHPHFVAKVQEQVAQLVHVSNLVHNPQAAKLAERLTALSGMDRAFMANSGCEANEAALKFALLKGAAALREEEEEEEKKGSPCLMICDVGL
jgi:N-acetyl-gamma-glutamyl-phosphate reductase common form